MKNICSKNVKAPFYPNRFPCSSELQDLINRLLIKSPEKRFGTNGGAAAVKSHPFFSNGPKKIDWARLEKKDLKAPYKPEVSMNFTTEYEGNASINIETMFNAEYIP